MTICQSIVQICKLQGLNEQECFVLHPKLYNKRSIDRKVSPQIVKESSNDEKKGDGKENKEEVTNLQDQQNKRNSG